MNERVAMPGWFQRGAAVAVLFSAAACGDPAVVGEWEGKDTYAGERNELEVDEEGEGEATFLIALEGDVYLFDFTVEWSEMDNGDFELDLSCDGDCSALDFRMECSVVNDDEEMECDGKDIFAGAEFEFERTSE